MAERSGFSTSSNQSLAGFVPALVIDNLLEKLRKKENRKLPEKQTFDSVVMFADISGFTNLAEKLTLKGPEGTELLAFTLNRYMELLVNGISRSGGDIFKFAGDAMIIVWPPPSDNNPEQLTVMCRQAIQSALDIQSKLTDFKIIDEVKLSVKIGFGVGQVTIAYVGGVFQRAEYLPAGSPLTQAFECEHLAPYGGVVIASKQIWERCCNFFEFEQINEVHNYKGENAPFFYVKKVKKTVKMKADAFLIKNKLKPGDLEAIRGSLKTYIPAAVVPFIELDQEKWSAELRRLSVLFVNLGIDLKDTQSQAGLERIQQVIECVQKCVYSNQGSLNKFLMDDKGSTLMVVFGLYPMAHQDDPVRAVLTATSLVNELKPIKCSCSVGVTTGMVFAGVVGTSGNRREYSVLGDSVNLSARFMQAACQEKEKKVLVDEVTKMEAEHKLKFRFVKKSIVKGKSDEINFFEPFTEEEHIEIRQSSDTKVSRGSLESKIKIHVVKGWDNKKMLGKSYECEVLKGMGLLEKFLNKPMKNGLVMIVGSYGAGKSLMASEIVEKMASRLESDSWKYNEKIQVYANSLNNMEKAKKMNGWRVILQEILTRLSLRTKQNCESVMYRLLEKNDELIDSLYLVSDILNTKFKASSGSNKNKYVQRAQEIYERKMIKKILSKLLLRYLEEEDENNDVSIEENLQKSQKSLSLLEGSTDLPKKRNDVSNTPAPLIIVLDDMQDYDFLSWDFTLKVLRKLKKVFLIACIRNKFIELPPVFKKQDPAKNTDGASTHSSHRKTISNQKSGLSEITNQEDLVESGIYEFEEICENSFFLRIELKGMERIECEQLLTKFLGVKKIEFDAGAVITSIKKPNNDKFFSFLMEKTEGIPLDVLNLSEKLRNSMYAFVDEERKIFVWKRELLKMIEINEFLTLETPLCRLKVNGPIIDRLFAPHLLLMKAAAVIGDVFDIQTLLKVNPFKSSISNEKARSIINDLERQDFIEILDEQNNNVRYRFTSPFMREVIYQRMTYNQRRNIHRYVAEAIQAIPLMSNNPPEERLECERLVYHWCLAENKDPFLQNALRDPNVDFSNKAKRSIIVKKISSLLSKNPNNLNVIIKKGELDKKSDRGFKWSKRYCIMNPREFKYYYTEEDSYRDSSIDQPLGTIPFKNIFQIMPLKETESKGKAYAFVIYVGSWQKKDKEMGIREFYFSAFSNDELEQWTTYMEFIRAKAIYDSFVNTFGKISFPLTNNALEKIDSEEGMKFGQGMSRMTTLTAKEPSHQSFMTSYKSPNYSIRKTTFKPMNMKEKLRRDIGFIEQRENSNLESLISNYNAECHKKLKERLSHLFESTFFLFWSHVFELSNRNARNKIEKTDPNLMILGHNTSFMKEKNHHFFFERSLFDDVAPPQSPFFDKRISKYQTSFSINGRSSIASIIYNSMDSLDDVSKDNNTPSSVKEREKHFGGTFSSVKPLTNIDENVASEAMVSPQVKLKKSILVKPDEKFMVSLQAHNDNDISGIVPKKSQIFDESQKESLEKIEEVNETRESIMNISGKSLVILQEKFSLSDYQQKNRKSSPGEISLLNNLGKRKSRFLKMMSPTGKNENRDLSDLMSQKNGKSERDINMEDLKQLPILSVKIGENSRKYADEGHGLIQPDLEEIVVKTRKGDVSGRNENYGEIWKKLTNNQIKFNNPDSAAGNKERNEESKSGRISMSVDENKEEETMREILRESVQKITGKEKELDGENKKSSLKSPPSLHTPVETMLDKLEKWEEEHPSPSEESLPRHHLFFTPNDHQYLNFPFNIPLRKPEYEYISTRTEMTDEKVKKIVFSSLETPIKLEKCEESVSKKKMKKYSEFESKKKETNEDQKDFFKDYETLCNSSRWESNTRSHRSGGKQESLGNLNYKTIKNFQSKS